MAGNAEGREKPLWEVGLGAVDIDFPDYRGSDQRHNYLLPLPYVVYRGEFFRVDREGVRGLLFTSDRITLNISVDGAVPAKSEDNEARRGMPDLDPTAELGPSLNFHLFRSAYRRIDLRLATRTVLATDFSRIHQEGWLFHPHLNFNWRNTWNRGLSFGPLYATEAYHQYYYGVAPAFATAERPAYKAKGGYSGLRLTLSASRRFDHMWLGGFLRVDSLAGSIFEDSPLVREDYAVMAGIGLAYIFKRSTQMVPEPPNDWE